MELMTKYQYTYFIYPYVIDSNKYSKYMQKLLKNKNCKLRIFEKEKDMHLYQYFFKDIREYLFWTFNLDKKGIRSLESMDTALKATQLANHECNVFDYELTKELQGKVGEKNGIFFDIQKIKIVCFKTGICFLIFKTELLDNKSFSDVLNFNYKFREIHSKTYELKEYEKIRLQSDMFKDVKEINGLIKEITGYTYQAKSHNWNDEKMIAYSYCCLDQINWNDETDELSIDNLFNKYRMFYPANKQGSDIITSKLKMKELYENKYVHYGVSNAGTVLLTSDINPANYTFAQQKFQSEYLYTYILELYKKFLLKKISSDFNRQNNFKRVEKCFLDFTKNLWIQEITDDETGSMLCKMWEEDLNIQDIFLKLKNKYDILYKRYNIEETSNKNGRLGIAMVIVIVICVINLVLLLGRVV